MNAKNLKILTGSGVTSCAMTYDDAVRLQNNKESMFYLGKII